MNKVIFLLLLLLPAFFGCEKAKEKVQSNIVVQALVNGQWRIEDYIVGYNTPNPDTLTQDFANFKWQFRENKTVEAINNNSIVSYGTWQENITTMTMTTSFPGSPYPVHRMNGNWKIVDHGWTYVEARQLINGDSVRLHLEKL